MNIEPTKKNILIIPAVTPYFLEKGESWFLENFERILRSRRRQGWWKKNVIVLEDGILMSATALTELLIDFGYQRTDTASYPAEFSRRGGFFLIFPVGSRTLWRIEFVGNRVERVLAQKTIEAPEAPPKLKIPSKEFGELSRLKPGDYVVHQDHGIGIFRGIVLKEALNADSNLGFFVIEYAPPKKGGEPDRLFVPLAQANPFDELRVRPERVEWAKKLSIYYGFETPTIHRLGSDAWSRTKRKAKEDVIKFSRELLSLYVSRHRVKRPPYAGDPALEMAIEAGFLHIETDDQIRAIRDISDDLSADEPMDRILVGDVGFGKTEVALRAAAKSVIAGKQAALVAPTTILAEQHFRVFRERLEPLGILTGHLSRLVGGNAKRQVISKLASGEIDVAVGTHRILSKDIQFKNLGLLIVDEEQRFGVKQKEKLKIARSSLDVLSLSATPIPRTMYMALAKLRPMSVLKTPPPGRMAIKTFVLPYSRKIVRDAIFRELARKGQVYFLHNRVETMQIRAEELRRILGKEISIEFIHGRMREKELVDTMERFRNGKTKVLVATTIIENGLDLANVNTLIVADAVRLGLGQAHQIRGRVGRGDVQAYAYFLYSRRHLSGPAQDRLRALQEFQELGSGYELAVRDLEIRGAGNILGREQSGAINSVGLNLYMQLLSETIEDVKRESPSFRLKEGDG